MTKFSISQSHHSQTDNSELSLKEILHLLRRHFVLIATIAATVFIITILYTLIQAPTYTSSTMVVVEDKNQTGAMFDFDMGSNLNLVSTMNNEVQLLKSRTLSEEVVRDLWNSPNKNNLFLFGTRKLVPIGNRKIVRGLWDSIFNTSHIASYFNNVNDIPDSVLLSASGAIRSTISVTNERKTNVLNIAMTSNDPVEASLLANTVARLYQQRDMEWSAGEIVSRSDVPALADILRAFKAAPRSGHPAIISKNEMTRVAFLQRLLDTSPLMTAERRDLINKLLNTGNAKPAIPVKPIQKPRPPKVAKKMT